VKSTIILKSLTWSDRGPVSCIGESILGNASANGYVDVLSKPKIEFLQNSLFAYIGTSFTFPACKAVSNPAAVITLKRGYKKMVAPRFNISANSITISKVQLNDEGLYICKAVNFLGSDEVTVQFKTKPLEFLQAPPNFQNIIKGETVSLSCSAYGNPTEMAGKCTYAKTYWDKGDEIKSEVEKNLTIFNVTVAATQSGVYECHIKQAESIINKKIYMNFATIESSILNTTQKKQLISWLSRDKETINFALCESVSSYHSTDPRSTCGSKTKTLTIIKDVEGCIFGGYSTRKFDDKWQTVENSFLFDFNKSIKFEARSPEHANQCSYSELELDYGPCFGANDLYTYYDTHPRRPYPIIYQSKVGNSYNDHGVNNGTLGCSANREISTMEILYAN